MVLFQALAWESSDSENEYIIHIFGKTEDGKSVCVSTPFQPYFFVRLPKNSTVTSTAGLFQQIRTAVDGKIVSYDILKSKDLWGFQNNEMFNFMKLTFNTHADMKRCDSKLRYPLKDMDRTLRVYESNIDPVLRFMHRSNIQSTGWIDSGDTNCIRSHLTFAKIDLFCNDWKTLKPVARDDNAPFVIASFDIECFSSTGKFPDADTPEDVCFQIAFTLKRSTEVFNKTCLCLKATNPANNGDIICFETERDLIMGFKDYIKKYDIDILTGWNIFGFDLEYIYKRALINKCPQTFFNELGRVRGRDCEMVYKKLSSSALGDNTLKLLPMHGRFIFDLFHEVKREQKLDSYSLNNVAKLYVGDEKYDMPPKEIFKRYHEGDADKLREVAEYCIQDTMLPHLIMDKLCNIPNLFEMAKATWVPLYYLVERGQQIKVFSQLTRKARELQFMVPTIRYRQQSGAGEGYEGATVLDAQIGAYYTPITALDFEGLYPSIMMAHNLCYSTFVMDPKYDSIPGVTYESFEIQGKTYKFAQNVPSLLPEILAELKQFRKSAKKDMAAAKDHTMKMVYNGKQLAYKVSMNSVYGFTGALKGMLPCVVIASAVTCEGRHMIDQTKDHVEANFPGAKVRYGDTDSVMVEFDVEGRTGQEAVEYSWKQGELAAKMCNQLFKSPKNLELEKVYFPYILYSKKRYAAKLWTMGRDNKMKMDYIDVKGLQVVRRDNTPFVRETCKEILDVILESKNPEEARKVAHAKALELLDGKVDMSKLILSQKLGDNYKSTNLPHVMVRNKIREREPGSEPQSGDRVQFVIVKNEGLKQFEKAEDPKWVKSHPTIELDYHYYFTNKFMNPVCDLLEPLVENPKQIIFGDLLDPPKRRKKVEVKSHSIMDMFNKFKDKKQ
jgi:DNA polymerase delta subunit 1